MGRRKRTTGKPQLAAEERVGKRVFGSDVGVVVALLPPVVPPLSVAVPLVLPALPPPLVVVAAVAVGSSGWWSKTEKDRRDKRKGGFSE